MLYKQLANTLDIIAAEDEEVATLARQERDRQSTYIPLIPSENIVSPAVAAALASAFTNKYAEGYPYLWKDDDRQEGDGRYYQGQAFTNQLERLTIQRTLDLFTDDPSAYHANVQPLSGAPANLAVLSAFLQPGDTFMGLALDDGGHLTHGHKVSVTSHFFNAVQYRLNPEGQLDYDAIEALADKCHPKLIICGATAYPLIIDFERFGQIAKKHNAILVADISHIAGLCVTGQHPHPFPHADVITTTTHKILRGPRAGIIVCKKQYGKQIDKAVFPGLQGGPHINTMAALAVALKEDLSPAYKDYARQVVLNAKALADTLKQAGFNLIGGGTENHLILMDVVHSALDVQVEDASAFAKDLERAHIVANKNAVPGDLKPWHPSGIRLGTPSITTLGFKEEDAKAVGRFIIAAAKAKGDTAKLDEIGQEVVKFMERFTA